MAASNAVPTPVIGRLAVGICAAAKLIILGVIITDVASTSAAAVLSAMAPPSGPLGLLAFGLGASVILGVIFAVNSPTGHDPDNGKMLSLFRRNDLSGLSEAAPAMPLLGFSCLTYWPGFMGVTWFAWRRNAPASAVAQVSATLTLIGAAALALWLILVALGMTAPHSATNGTPEQP